MSERVAAFLFTAYLATLCGCATTRFKSTWIAPNAAPLGFEGHKVLALVQALDDGWGRPAELALAAQLNLWGVEGIAAHTVITEHERADRERLEVRLKQLAIAGVVILRVTHVKTEYPYIGPAQVGTTRAGGYYDAWNDASWNHIDLSAPPPQGDTRVYMETSVYSTERAGLVWSGESRSRNPASVESLVRQIAAAAAVELRRAGLITRAVAQ